MFILEFDDSAKVLRKVVDILKERIPEITMVVKPDGIYLQSMDNSHVALVDLVIYRAAASLFDCDDQVHELGIRMGTLAKIFHCHSSSGTCRIIYNEVEEPDILNIQFSIGGTVSSYQLKLVDGCYEELSVSEDNIPKCHQTVDATLFQHKLKDVSNFAEVITLQRKDKEIEFNATGDDASVSFTMAVTDDDDSDNDDPDNDDTSDSFALTYLQWFAKAATLSDNVLIAFGDELPLMAQYTEEDVYKLRFFLARKVSDV